MIPANCGSIPTYRTLHSTLTPSVGFRLAAAIQPNTIPSVGLWDWFRRPDGTGTRTFVIITAVPNALMAGLHDRI
jgi:hypothetical protein